MAELHRFKVELELAPMTHPWDMRGQGWDWRSIEQADPFLTKEYGGHICDGIRDEARKLGGEATVGLKSQIKGDMLLLIIEASLDMHVTHFSDLESFFNEVTSVSDLSALNIETCPKPVRIYHWSKKKWEPVFNADIKHVHRYGHVGYYPSTNGVFELLKCERCEKVVQQLVEFATDKAKDVG